MTPMTKDMLLQLLVPFFHVFFFIGGLFGLAVGIGLMLFSGRMFRIFEVMNRWVSYRQPTKVLAIPRNSWPTVQRHRHWFAALFVGGALFSLYNLIKTINVAALTRLAGAKAYAPSAYMAWIIESAWWMLVTGSLLAIAVGLMLVFFPKALEVLETGSSHWYSSRHATKKADELHLSVDKWVEAYPRAAGAIIAVASLVEVVDIGVLML